MKYIKQFNEELTPSIYRSASFGLRKYNNNIRADKLSDYADELEFGTYNIKLNGGFRKCDIVEFTNPVITNIYYGFNNYKDEEELVNEWKHHCDDGYPLTLDIEFGFTPTKKSTFSLKGESISINDVAKLDVKTTNSNYTYNNGHRKTLPTFMIEVKFAESPIQLTNKEYDGDVQDLYRHLENISLTLRKPQFGSWCGIFADRKSALTFKKRLNVNSKDSLITDDIKSRIMDILNLVGGSVSDYERILKLFNDVRVNGLCSTEDIGEMGDPLGSFFDKDLNSPNRVSVFR